MLDDAVYSYMRYEVDIYSGEYVDGGLTGCDAMWACRWVQKFQRNRVSAVNMEAHCRNISTHQYCRIVYNVLSSMAPEGMR
jgi:hypothetical protein